MMKLHVQLSVFVVSHHHVTVCRLNCNGCWHQQTPHPDTHFDTYVTRTEVSRVAGRHAKNTPLECTTDSSRCHPVGACPLQALSCSRSPDECYRLRRELTSQTHYMPSLSSLSPAPLPPRRSTPALTPSVEARPPLPLRRHAISGLQLCTSKQPSSTMLLHVKAWPNCNCQP